MLRLFVSLYVVIVLALFSINWGSEQVWRYFVDEQETAHQELTSIVKALPHLILSEHQAISFQRYSDYPLTTINMSDISLPQAQLTELQKGQVVVSYDDNDQKLLFVQAVNKNNLLQLGPLPVVSTISPIIKYALLFASYLLLAAVIALWTRPIWFDLLQLQTMAKQISQGDFQINSKINTRSPTAVVVKIFTDMAERITQLLVEQQQLINAVSHELRTPLSRLKFSLPLLKEQPQKPVDDIKKDITEMEQLVDELLGYARIENVLHDQEKNKVNIDQLLTNQVAKHTRATSKQLYLKVVDDLHYLCHGHLVERAVQNLLTNALRYAKKNVVIEAFVVDNMLNISVSDDGEGIAEKDREIIFNTFARIDKSRNKNEGGFGLGLAIVKRIVELHHGKCVVTESVEGGATFTLFIPN